MQDVPARGQVEQAPHEGDERMRLAVQAAQLGIFDFDLVTGRLHWSENQQALWGYRPGEFAGTRESFASRVNPADLSHIDAQMQECMQSRRRFDQEFRVIWPDASIHWMHALGEFSFDAGGAPTHLRGVTIETTLHKQAEEAIRGSAKRAERHVRELNRVYAVLSDVNQVIVREKDPEVLLSAACRTAVEKGEFLMAWIGMLDTSRKRLVIAAHHGTGPETMEIVKSLVAGDTPQCEFTYRALHQGTTAVCDDIATDPLAETWRAAALERGYRSMAALPLRKQGAVAGTFNLYSSQAGFFDKEELALLNKMAMDISFALDVRELEERYRQAQKMEAIGQLAGGVAHDFNNLLVIIQGFATLLLEEPLTTEGAEAARQIAQAAERASNLTKQLLAFSRRQVMQRRTVDLNAIIGNLQAMLLRIVGEHIRLRVSLHPQQLLMSADSSQIDQIILNLVVNARDAMAGGGEISLETTERTLTEKEVAGIAGGRIGRHVCLLVSDTGCGIPAQDLPRIFEPFFTTKKQGKGTGLGLSTVYGIVTQHGGSIKVMSDTGRGTAFEICLPASDVEHSGLAQRRFDPKATRGTETILVVEDDPDVRRLTCNVLSRQGYRILQAGLAVDALDLWEREGGNVDLLLTDMIMPGGISGRELAQRLRGRKPQLRVVLTSGYSPEIAGSELPSVVGERFIQKPAPIPELLAIVRRCLDDPPAPGK